MPGIRPLLKLSYTANWASGLGLAGFHLFNLACHAANALMALAVFRRWRPPSFWAVSACESCPTR